MNDENVFIKFGFSTSEAIKSLKQFSKALIEATTLFKSRTQRDKTINKILHIYKNTKKHRIRKKQLTRLNKIKEKRTKDNGSTRTV